MKVTKESLSEVTKKILNKVVGEGRLVYFNIGYWDEDNQEVYRSDQGTRAEGGEIVVRKRTKRKNLGGLLFSLFRVRTEYEKHRLLDTLTRSYVRKKSRKAKGR